MNAQHVANGPSLDDQTVHNDANFNRSTDLNHHQGSRRGVPDVTMAAGCRAPRACEKLRACGPAKRARHYLDRQPPSRPTDQR